MAPVAMSIACSGVWSLAMKYLLALVSQSSMLCRVGLNAINVCNLMSFSMGSKCALRAFLAESYSS